MAQKPGISGDDDEHGFNTSLWVGGRCFTLNSLLGGEQDPGYAASIVEGERADGFEQFCTPGHAPDF